MIDVGSVTDAFIGRFSILLPDVLICYLRHFQIDTITRNLDVQNFQSSQKGPPKIDSKNQMVKKGLKSNGLKW